MTKALAVAFLMTLAACAAPAPPREVAHPTPEGQRILAVITSYLPGTFDSIAHQNGPGAGTRMRIAQFWKEREKAGEFWFYVEHAKVAQDPKPFRQRIYRFTESKGKLMGDVFELPGNPGDLVGEWRKEKPFEAYKPAQLREFEGCRLGVGQMTVMFWARTEGKACRAENPKAAHEFTEMLVNSAGMKDGEQGFDASGRQIAGEAGVWEFRRMSREPR